MGKEVLTTVVYKEQDVMPWSPVEIHLCCGGTYCLHCRNLLLLLLLLLLLILQ